MCDTMVIVGTSGVLFAKNSDRDPNEGQVLDWQPRRTYPAGTRLKCTWIEIPQTAATHAVLLSRPFWMWGAEIGANEHGVTIGNEAVFTKARYAKTGLTGMDLLRLALERSSSAQAAVDVIVALLTEFGQGGGCGLEHPNFTYHNSFLIADPQQAFVLETAGGQHAVEEVRGTRSISNGLTIPGFAERYSDRLRTRISACRLRQKRTQSLAERAESPGDLMGVLRDHGVGNASPKYAWTNGGLGVPCVHAGGRIAASQTTASWVADLNTSGVQHWVTATAAPCTSLFKPVSILEPLALGPVPTERADRESLWWQHEHLHRAVMRDPERLKLLYLGERNALEASWLLAPPHPLVAFDEARSLTRRWTERVVAADGSDVRPRFVQRYWQKRNEWAGLA